MKKSMIFAFAAVLAAMIMMTGAAYADVIEIHSAKAKSPDIDSIPVLWGEQKRPTINITEPSGLDCTVTTTVDGTSSSWYWVKWDTVNEEWPKVYDKTLPFSTGKWKLRCQFRLEKIGATKYVIADDFTFTVNGKKWEIPEAPQNYETYCMVFVQSPVYSLRMENTIDVTVQNKTIKYKKLKKRSQTVAPFGLCDNEGPVTFKKVSVTKKQYSKYFTVGKTSGKIRVKKGLRKGKYVVKVKVTAAGNDTYKAKSLTRKVTIRVK